LDEGDGAKGTNRKLMKICEHEAMRNLNMLSVFQSLPVRLATCAITLTWAFHNAIFLPDTWQGVRQPGEELTGYWRSAKDEACYRDTLVIHFQGSNMTVHRYGKTMLFHDNTHIAVLKGKVILKFPAGDEDSEWNVDSSIYLQDNGNRLNSYKFSENGKDYNKDEFAKYIQKDPRMYDFVKCSDYDISARLKLIVFPPMKDI
jgi:hypothetical protein